MSVNILICLRRRLNVREKTSIKLENPKFKYVDESRYRLSEEMVNVTQSEWVTIFDHTLRRIIRLLYSH